MEDLVRQRLFEIIYNKLELKQIEEELIKNNIPKKNIYNPNNVKLVSNYFFLRNDVYLNRLTRDEIDYINKSINSSDENIVRGLNNFLERNLQKLIMPETDEKYFIWEGNSMDYMAPSDAIVLAFHTLAYQDENFDEDVLFEREKYIAEKLNYIQYTLAPSKNMKVAVFEYNELQMENNKIIK